MKIFDSIKRNQGFTLIEITIVMLIIGVLLSIASLNLMRSANIARTKACIRSLKAIDSAKEQWAMENQRKSDDTPTWADLKGPRLYIKSSSSIGLICQMGGIYTIGSVDTLPICSLGTSVNPPHVLPESSGN